VVQAAPSVPAVASGTLRRSIILAACLGAAAVLFTGLLGHILAGLFVCVGLALGGLNTFLVQRAVVNYATSPYANKKARFTRSVLGRLGLVTVIALGVGVLFRPDGLGVFAGLAFFQMLMLGGATVPVIKQLRNS